MKKLLPLILSAVFITTAAHSQENDHIFPAATSAKKYIDFDRQGFIINGKKTFLVSAGLEYARIPHQLWYDRLLRLKRAGFNCIEIYTFWNFHEPHEGQFEFSGDHDLDVFLKLVNKLGMYAIVRVGPYYCAEWNFGGYPIWLRFKDGLEARVPNAEFEKYVDRFFEKLIPIVSNNQINHGGSVVLVQLENEHSAGWGTLMPNEYFSHLQTKALSLGLQVPYFFSGLHHGGDPAGNGTKAFDDTTRSNPWLTTEFWSVWYNYYGSNQKDADQFGRRSWKIIAHGGGGYNYYMAHGGTNFGYSNSDEDAASYDYGAAVGQTGDLRPIYYQFKTNALFARSFQSILCNSSDVSAAYKNIISDTTVRVYARHSLSGDIAFLDNPTDKNVSVHIAQENLKLPAGNNITLASQEIMPVVLNYKLTPKVKLNSAVTRILGISEQGNTHTIVVYGAPGSTATLQFTANDAIQTVEHKEAFKISAKTALLWLTFKDQTPAVYSFKAGTELIQVIALNPALANRTWFAEAGGKQYIVTGPEYLSDISVKNNHLQLTTEHFWEQKQLFPVWVFEGAIAKTINAKAHTPQHIAKLSLGDWQSSNASLSADPAFDDSGWLKSNNAVQMGTDGDLSCYAWYRTNFNVNTAGDYVLKIRTGGDNATVYIDNVRVASEKIPNDISIPQLSAGKHSMAIFTAHSGRNKLYNYYGPLKYVDVKGLSGDIILQKGKTTFLTEWKMADATSRDDIKNGTPDFNNAVDYNIGDDAFNKKKGYKWFQANISTEDGKAPTALFIKNLSGSSVVFVNGKQITPEKLDAGGFNIPLDGNFNTSGTNTLTVFIENKNNRKGGLNSPFEVVYNRKDNIALNNWRMKGGPGDTEAITGWKSLTNDIAFDRPQFYKTNFNLNSTNSNIHAMWRITFEGLGHGSIWVNGHNLGRYPEKIPVKSLYIPECWLVKGNNSVLIYDENGNRPDKVSIGAETAASRDVEMINF